MEIYEAIGKFRDEMYTATGRDCVVSIDVDHEAFNDLIVGMHSHSRIFNIKPSDMSDFKLYGIRVKARNLQPAKGDME